MNLYDILHSVAQPPQNMQGMGQPANFMQALNGGAGIPAAPAPDPMTPAAPQTNALAALAQPQTAPAPAMSPAPAMQDQPRRRQSIIDTIGRIADVFAKVGGAPGQYQPTLDANLARTNAAEDRTRSINLENLKMQVMQNQMRTATTEADRANAGKAIQAAQAIAGDDPQKAALAWQSYAKLFGVSPELTQEMGQRIATDGLSGVDQGMNGIEEYATAPQLAVNRQTGETELVQVGKHGGKQITRPDDGFSFAPANVVSKDTGGETVAIDPRTGAVVNRVRNTVSPDTAANNATRVQVSSNADASRERVAALTNSSKERIAAAKGTGTGAKATATAGKAGDPTAALTALDNISRDFDKLHSLKALPGDGGSVTDRVTNAFQRMVPGANSIAEQAGSPAAQQRRLIVKSLNDLQQQVIKSLPASAVRNVYEQRIIKESLPDPYTMSLPVAKQAIQRLRDSWMTTLRRAQAAAGTTAPAAAPGRRTLAAPAGARTSKPTFQNW